MILLCYWEMSFYAFGCHGVVNITVAMSLGGAVHHRRRRDGFLCRSKNCSALSNVEWFQLGPALPLHSCIQDKSEEDVFCGLSLRFSDLILNCWWSPALLSWTPKYLSIYSVSVSKPPKPRWESHVACPMNAALSRLLSNWEFGWCVTSQFSFQSWSLVLSHYLYEN